MLLGLPQKEIRAVQHLVLKFQCFFFTVNIYRFVRKMRGKEHWWSRRQYFLFPMGIQQFWAVYLKCVAFMRKTGSKTSGLHKYSELKCLNLHRKLKYLEEEK